MKPSEMYGNISVRLSNNCTVKIMNYGKDSEYFSIKIGNSPIGLAMSFEGFSALDKLRQALNEVEAGWLRTGKVVSHEELEEKKDEAPDAIR